MLYKYCTTKGFDIFLNSRLKAARISGFNDPFELDFGIDTANALRDITNEFYDNIRTTDILHVWRNKLDAYNVEYNAKDVNDILIKICRLQISRFSEAKRDIRRGWDKTVGIICLSEEPNIIQMWAHYCSNHEGIVIGIEESEVVGGKKDALVKVEYDHDGMPLWPVRLSVDEQHGMRLLDVMRKKEANWKYEKEVRIYIDLDEKDEDGNYYYSIPSNSIKEIYLGLRSTETTRIMAESIRQREQYEHLRLYQMQKQESTYGLKAIEMKR